MTTHMNVHNHNNHKYIHIRQLFFVIDYFVLHGDLVIFPLSFNKDLVTPLFKIVDILIFGTSTLRDTLGRVNRFYPRVIDKLHRKDTGK